MSLKARPRKILMRKAKGINEHIKSTPSGLDTGTVSNSIALCATTRLNQN